MTPQEKAQELIKQYSNVEIEVGGQHDGYVTMKPHEAKQCALIAVEQVLKNIEVTILFNPESTSLLLNKFHWNEVKNHLQP